MKNKIIIIGSIIAAFALGYFISPKAANNMQNTEHQHDSADETIYTCSMHPQIRQNEPGNCPICGMTLIPVDSDGGGNKNPLVFEMTQEAVTLSGIATTKVGEGGSSIKNGLKLTGKVQADETTTASIVAHIPGRIEQLYIRFTGEHIKKGDRVATIYSADLIAAQRELLEADKIKDITPALLEAAKNKLRYWKITEHQIDKILASRKVQENFDIYSEYAGVVTKRKVSVADHLMEGSVLFEIQDLSKVWAVFDVYENDLGKIRVGQKVKFSAAGIPNKTFTAVINFVDPLIRPDTRTASVRATIRNTNGKIKPEMFLSGVIQTPSSKGKKVDLSVPKTAVLWTGERSVVYVKLPDAKVPSFEFREVVLGDVVGNNYLIKSGLSEGEEVVTKGAFVIDASAQLNNQTSMMNRLVSIKDAPKPQQKIPDYTNASANFKKQLADLAQAYLKLKVAFVKTDPITASNLAQAFNTQLAKVDMKLLKGDAHLYWMRNLKALDAHAKKVSQLNDIEKQRRQFQFISDAMIETLKAFGSSKKLYVEHCPMAFDGEGADWISSESNIMNPYFGSVMMNCGSVVDSLGL